MGRDPEARARISGKVEFLEISEILPFGVDIADPIFRNSVISVKHMGRYGYGGPPGPSPDPEVWAQILGVAFIQVLVIAFANAFWQS